MLAPSDRHTPRDLQVWNQLERYDHAIAQRINWSARITRAHKDIHQFTQAGGCYASTSWGKDSTVIAHLCATSGIVLPLVYIRLDGLDNPDSITVRDMFLAEYGHLVDYHEITVPSTNVARWWHEDTTGMVHHAPDPGFKQAGKQFGNRHISGVRGQESRIRGLVQARWGTVGLNACRPIGDWKATDVFAYLNKHNLPVHPSYAMNMSGTYDRQWIRVSTIGGIRGADKQRADWEQTYYPDIIQHAQHYN